MAIGELLNTLRLQEPALVSVLPIAAQVSLSGYALPLGTPHAERELPALTCVRQTDLFGPIYDQMPGADESDNTSSVLQSRT